MRIMTVKECKRNKHICACGLDAIFEDDGNYYCSCCRTMEVTKVEEHYSEADYETWMKL